MRAPWCSKFGMSVSFEGKDVFVEGEAQQPQPGIGGIFGKRCIPPPSCTQGCALSQKISMFGLSQEVSSSVPARRAAMPGNAAGSDRIVEPQFGHNRRT